MGDEKCRRENNDKKKCMGVSRYMSAWYSIQLERVEPTSLEGSF